MTKHTETTAEINAAIKDDGIKVVSEEVEGNVKLKFYVDDPDDFNKTYILTNSEGEPTGAKARKGDLVGESEIVFNHQSQNSSSPFTVTEKKTVNSYRHKTVE